MWSHSTNTPPRPPILVARVWIFLCQLSPVVSRGKTGPPPSPGLGMGMGTGSHFQRLLGPAPLPWTARAQGQKGPRPQGRRWHPRKSSQAGWPASLPFKDRLSLQIPWGPLGGCILLPSPGTLAGPGVSAGLLSSPFPGQQSETGPGERCLCWLFRVVHCAVCVLPLGSPEVSALTLTVHQDPDPTVDRDSSPAIWTCQAVPGRSMTGMF